MSNIKLSSILSEIRVNSRVTPEMLLDLFKSIVVNNLNEEEYYNTNFFKDYSFSTLNAYDYILFLRSPSKLNLYYNELSKFSKDERNLEEIQVKPKLQLKFNDTNIYIGTYKGNGSSQMNELMKPDQVVNLYNLGHYVTFIPTGNLEAKTFLMPKNWFGDVEIDKFTWGGRTLESRIHGLQWIKKAIDNNLYTVL